MLLKILESRLPLYLQLFLAILCPLGLFLLSWAVVGETESLFTLFYVLLLFAIAFAFDLLPAIVSAVLIDLSIDFHYIKPIGRVGGSGTALGFAICCVVLFLAMRLLRNSILAEHVAKLSSERAVKVRENILAMISHDLRQPISAAKLGIQVTQRFLEAENLDKAKKSSTTVRSSLEKLDEMVGYLVDAAKTDSGNFTANLKETALIPLLEKTVDQFALQAQDKQIEFSFNTSGIAADKKVAADSTLLSRVLSNYISNALKFTPSTGKVRIEAQCSESGTITVSVCDSGSGVKDESVSKLFERNWQEKSSAHLGSGLGLYICKGIMAAHGGRAWYEKKPGWGACFCFNVLDSVTLQTDNNPSPDCRIFKNIE
jgi:signal transduction histidine kinase